MSSKAGESCIFAAFTAFFSVKVMSRLYLDKFDILKRHLVNVFCFVMLIISFLNSNLTVARKFKNGGSLSYTRETIV